MPRLSDRECRLQQLGNAVIEDANLTPAVMDVESDQFLLVYVTTPDLDTAETIIKDLLERRLVACANVFPGSQSHYVWNGQLRKENETLVFLKSMRRLFPKLKETILALHPYETPCILGLPVNGGHESFLSWISKSTSETV